MRLFLISILIFSFIFVQDCRNNEVNTISFGLSESLQIEGNLIADLTERHLENFNKYCAPKNAEIILNKAISSEFEIYIGMALGTNSRKLSGLYSQDNSFKIFNSKVENINDLTVYFTFGKKENIYFYNLIYSPKTTSSVYSITLIGDDEAKIKGLYQKDYFIKIISRFTK